MPELIKAEMWDKMQYLFRNYYDRMVHCVQYYDGLIDIKVLKTVLVYMTEKVPVLHSSFHGNVIEPYWTVDFHLPVHTRGKQCAVPRGALQQGRQIHAVHDRQSHVHGRRRLQILYEETRRELQQTA